MDQIAGIKVYSKQDFKFMPGNGDIGGLPDHYEKINSPKGKQVMIFPKSKNFAVPTMHTTVAKPTTIYAQQNDELYRITEGPAERYEKADSDLAERIRKFKESIPPEFRDYVSVKTFKWVKEKK